MNESFSHCASLSDDDVRQPDQLRGARWSGIRHAIPADYAYQPLRQQPRGLARLIRLHLHVHEPALLEAGDDRAHGLESQGGEDDADRRRARRGHAGRH